jgi:hypothetical protein
VVDQLMVETALEPEVFQGELHNPPCTTRIA